MEIEEKEKIEELENLVKEPKGSENKNPGNHFRPPGL